MRTLTFAGRNAKEIIRDPLTICFGLGFPLILIFLLSAIQANVPVPLFEIEHLTPGITVFGLSFMTLFSATLISKDRGSSLLQRLYTSPLRPIDFILGYTLPIIPFAVAQSIICYLVALILGLELTVNILLAVLFILPISVLFIALGLLFGSILSDKQVGGICGALLTNLSAWLSGTWFDLELVGGAFRKIAYALPFVHAVELERAVLSGNFVEILPHLWWVLGYAVAALAVAVLLFLRQMKKQSQRNEQNRDGNDQKNRDQNIYREFKTEQERHKIANDALCHCKGNDRQGIAEYKIDRSERCCVQSL